MAFCYYARPMAGMQKYTGQPDIQGTVSSEDAVSELAQRAAVSLEQMETMIRVLGQFVIERSMNCWRIDPLLGWFGFQGTCGGSHDTPNFFPTFDSLDVDVRMRMGDVAKAYAREQFTPQKVGNRPLVTPEIVRVTNMHTGAENTYTPGKPIQVELFDARGKMDPSQTTQGVFFTSVATGTKTRVTDYAYNKGSTIGCMAPAGLTGDQRISVTLMLNRALRTGTYVVDLTPEAGTEAAPVGNGGRSSAGKGKDIVLRS